MRKYFSKKEKAKIYELFYSGVEANDKLAFEIIKQLDKKSVFDMPLVVVMLFSNDGDFRNEILKYLDSKLTAKQKDYLNAFQRFFEFYGMPSKFTNPFDTPPFFEFIPKELSKGKDDGTTYKNIEDHFSKEEISELAFIYFKKTGIGLKEFFQYNDAPSNNSKRKETLKIWLRNFSGNVIQFPKLYANEVEQLFKKVLSKLTEEEKEEFCLLYTSPSPRDQRGSRMPSSA